MSTFDYNSAKQKDQQLWETWKQTGSKKHLGELVEQLSPVIYSEVHRASGTLPTAALGAEAKKWTIKAIQSYDPSKGTTLSTHVMNYLPKVRRMNYKYQNAVRLPENMQLKYHEYNRQLTQLTDQLNREPTEEELSKALGWSKPQVIKLKNSMFADLIESSSDRPGVYIQFNQNSILMEHLMSQLTSDEKLIFEYAKGTPSNEVADKLGVNLNRYNYLRKKLIDKIQNIKHEIGM